MPRGRRGNRRKRDYPREIEEAVGRMQKYPEHLQAAKDSEEWHNFLQDNGIFTSYSPEGNNFWEQVRDRTFEKEMGFTARSLAEQGVEVITGKRRQSERDAKSGKFVKGTGEIKEYMIFRNYETKKFVSRKSLTNN
jgi:hypothetical protein